MQRKNNKSRCCQTNRDMSVPWEVVCNAGAASCLVFCHKGRRPDPGDFLRGDITASEVAEMELLRLSLPKNATYPVALASSSTSALTEQRIVAPAPQRSISLSLLSSTNGITRQTDESSLAAMLSHSMQISPPPPSADITPRMSPPIAHENLSKSSFFHSLQGPILFGAAHSTKVWRGGGGERRRLHKAERWACDIASRLALAVESRLGVQGSLMVWNPVSIPGRTDPALLDPNYLKPEQFAQCPWNAFVKSWAAAHRQLDANIPLLHIDIHGRHDHESPSTLDLGTAPMLTYWPNAQQAACVRDAFANRLRSVLVPEGFLVDDDPTLCGLWEKHVDEDEEAAVKPRKGSVSRRATNNKHQRQRHTSSHQSVLMNIPAVQFEVPRTLRCALVSRPSLFEAFADAIVAAYLDIARELLAEKI